MATVLARAGKVTLEIGSGVYAASQTHYEAWRKKRGPNDSLILSDTGFRIKTPAALPRELRACITPTGAQVLGSSHGTRSQTLIRPEDAGRVWFMRQTLPHLDFHPESVHEVVANNLFSDGYSGYSPASVMYLTLPRRISTAVREIDHIVRPGGRFVTTDDIAPYLVRWGAIRNEFERRGWEVKLLDAEGRPIGRNGGNIQSLEALKPRVRKP